jgi:PAS domain S-box-containing protein
MRTSVAATQEEPLEDSRAVAARSARHAMWAGAIAAALSSVSLLGWASGISALTSLVPDAVSFKANTALAVLAAGCSMMLQAKALRRDSKLISRAARALAWVPLLVGGAILAQYVFGVDLRIDQLLVADRATTIFPGRPSPLSAAALVLLAGVLLLGARTRHVAAYQVSAVLVGALTWAALVVLAFDLSQLGMTPRVPPPSLPASMSYLSLVYGALWLSPRHGIGRMLLSDTAAGSAARRLVPPAALLPVALGWLVLVGVREGWFGPEIGLALFTAGTIVGYLSIGGLGIWIAYRLETARDAAMRQLTERLQLATRAAHIGIWDWDLATNTLVWDRGMHELYGVPEGEFGGTYAEWKRCLVEEDLAPLEEAVRSALAGSADLTTEFRVRRRDGSVRVMQGRSTVVRDARGEPLRILGADIDVTAQRDAEASRLASERRFRAIFDNATNLISLLRPDGTVIEANRVSLELVGQPASEVIGRPFWESCGWIDQASSKAQLERAVARATRGELVRHRERIGASDGQQTVVDFSLKPILDENGEIAQLLVEGHDITEAHRSRLALEESEERFRAAMEYAAIGIALVSLEGHFLKVNRALSEIVGYSEAELLELTFQDITHPEDLEADLAQANELREGRISHYHMEKRYFHKSGRVVWILLSGSIVRSPAGEPRVFVAEIQDITARKEHEAQLRASVTEKEVLLREIHHRVKNNLQVVSSMLRLQATRAGSRDLAGMFEDAQARIQAMALIHDRLYQSHNVVSIDFGAYLRALTSMLLQVFGRPEQTMGVEYDLETAHLSLDTAIPLALVANELITNSLKHAFPESKRGTIFISLKRAEDELVLRVGDDGAGFPDDFSFDSKRSLGMRLVTSFAHQLRGTLSLHRAGRSEISLSIPVPLPSVTAHLDEPPPHRQDETRSPRG